MNKDKINYCPYCDIIYDKPHKCSVGISKPDVIKAALLSHDGVLYKEIWNEAIEAAVLKVEGFHRWMGSADLASSFDKEGIAAEVRRLKK